MRSTHPLWIGPLCAAACIALATWWVGPARAGLVERPPIEELGFRQYPRFPEKLAESRPELLLMGNSITDAAISIPLLEARAKMSTMNGTLHGSASALWYLVMKNVVAENDPPPRLVVLGFRDVFLTEPTYRVAGRHKRYLDFYATHDEPLLDRLAYNQELGPVQALLEGHWSVWQRRARLRSSTEAWFLESFVGRVGASNTDEYMEAIDRVFSEEQKLAGAVDAAQIKAESISELHHFDFQRRLRRSFLPGIIDVLKQADIGLVLVRMPTRVTTAIASGSWNETTPWSEKLPQYIADLNAYLDKAGVPLLDFAGDPRITADWFARGDHLDKKTRQKDFTRMLLERLQPHLAPYR